MFLYLTVSMGFSLVAPWEQGRGPVFENDLINGPKRSAGNCTCTITRQLSLCKDVIGTMFLKTTQISLECSFSGTGVILSGCHKYRLEEFQTLKHDSSVLSLPFKLLTHSTRQDVMYLQWWIRFSNDCGWGLYSVRERNVQIQETSYFLYEFLS